MLSLNDQPGRVGGISGSLGAYLNTENPRANFISPLKHISLRSSIQWGMGPELELNFKFSNLAGSWLSTKSAFSSMRNGC